MDFRTKDLTILNSFGIGGNSCTTSSGKRLDTSKAGLDNDVSETDARRLSCGTRRHSEGRGNIRQDISTPRKTGYSGINSPPDEEDCGEEVGHVGDYSKASDGPYPIEATKKSPKVDNANRSVDRKRRRSSEIASMNSVTNSTSKNKLPKKKLDITSSRSSRDVDDIDDIFGSL